MSKLATYIFSVVCASVICSIANVLTRDKKQVNITVKLLSAIFLSITLLAPLKDFSVDRILSSWDRFTQTGHDLSHDGQLLAKEELSAIIKQRTETYILGKAEQLGVTLQAEIRLCEDLKPANVVITGKVTPYERKYIQNILTDELGIPKEDQLWR